MNNQISDRLESIFSKLIIKVSEHNKEVAKITAEEQIQIHQTILAQQEIRNEIRNSAFNQSLYLEWFLLFKLIIDRYGLKPENIDIQKDVNLSFLKSILIFSEDFCKILEKSIINISIEENFQNHKIELLETLDFGLIQSIFTDYTIAINVSKFIKGIEPEIKSEFECIKMEFNTLLENSANYWEITDQNKLRYKRAIINNGNKNPDKLFLSESMIIALFISINNLKEFNENILENSLTPELIREIIGLVKFCEDFNFKDETLKRLIEIFPNDKSITIRKKKLIIHDFLLYFNHPKAMNSIDEELHLRKEGATLDTLNQAKIRLVNHILGNFK